MTRFEFALATPADDAALRARMAEDWLRGPITVSFRREPSFFAAAALQGAAAQVIKCTERASGEIVGLGSRFITRAFLNGAPGRLGYLADLRCRPEYRGGTLLARGYRYLRALHERDPVALYYSLILDGNRTALTNLVGARAGLPVYRDHGRVLTPALPLDSRRPLLQLAGVELRRARPAELPALIEFLNRRLAEKQFAPCYARADFSGGRLRGLRAEDFFLALRDGRIAGSVAVWDQGAYRQTHVEAYRGALAWWRPVHNLLTRLTALKPLPARGERIPFAYLAMIAVEGDDPAIFRALLRAVYEACRRGPWHYLIPSLHERDPLAAAFAEYRRIEAAGRLFVIHYPEDEAAYRALDARVPYIEAATV